MKDGIILLVVIFLGSVTFFWGMKMIFRKSIDAAPTVEQSEEYKRMMRNHRHKTEDFQRQQKEAMRDQQQRIKDLQR